MLQVIGNEIFDTETEITHEISAFTQHELLQMFGYVPMPELPKPYGVIDLADAERTFGAGLGALVFEIQRRAMLLAPEDLTWLPLAAGKWSYEQPVYGLHIETPVRLCLTQLEAKALRDNLGFYTEYKYWGMYTNNTHARVEMPYKEMLRLLDLANERLGWTPPCKPRVKFYCNGPTGFVRHAHPFAVHNPWDNKPTVIWQGFKPGPNRAELEYNAQPKCPSATTCWSAQSFEATDSF